MAKSPRMLRYLALPALLFAVAGTAAPQQSEPRVLVFSRTTGYRHSSIESGIPAVQKLGRENAFTVEATEDPSAFSERNLKRFRAVVFLNTTGDVLNATQQDAFERYIQAGGGWVGIHSATDTEYEWPWYGRLAGAYFESHPGNPNVRKGTFRVVDTDHPATQGLPDRWEREDEFYNFKSIDPDIRVLVDIDETSYEGGTNGARHPMSWYHAFDGGRAFYTNMGHTEATFSEPLFLRHLLGGLRYAMGTAPLNYGRVRPEENRFTKVVLTEKLNEPVELAVLPDERVLFIERRGAVNLYRPATGRSTKIATIPVSNKYTGGQDGEDGLLGLAADPGFASNGWIYLYYSPAGPDPKNVLARYTMKGDSLDLASRAILLEVAVQRDQCCHTGGSIAFDRQGNLYLSTGDNTNPFATGYAPIDERPDRSPWDAQKSSANTNDLRGKIIRIHPEPNGTYTIPDGNLFPRGTPQTRPEIYTMGHRNPYRIAIDKRTGFVYWGEVGPDAPADSAERGPAGHDEIGQARRAGNFGWPHFVADNKAYFHVDFATMKAGPRFDPARPMNTSPNNTGLTELPPAQKAFIWYPYGPSAEFPLVGTGGRTAMAGPVLHRDDFPNAARPFPAYYDGKLFIYEWMRGWVMAVTMNAQGDLVSMERFMSSHKFSNPMDMEFGPNGDLYVLEYGTGLVPGQRRRAARPHRVQRRQSQADGRGRRRQAGRRDTAGGRAFVRGYDGSRRRRAAIRLEHLAREWDRRSDAHRSQPDVHLRETGRVHRVPRRDRRAGSARLGEGGDRRRQRAADGRPRSGREQPDVLLSPRSRPLRGARDRPRGWLASEWADSREPSGRDGGVSQGRPRAPAPLSPGSRPPYPRRTTWAGG